MNPAVGIQCFIEFVVRSLVTVPEKVAVEASEEEGQWVYRITLVQRDVAKVMGRDARGISSIRHLAEAAARQHQFQVRIHLQGEAEHLASHGVRPPRRGR